jgi:hypothetical protein
MGMGTGMDMEAITTIIATIDRCNQYFTFSFRD